MNKSLFMWQFVVKKSLKVILLNHWYGKKTCYLCHCILSHSGRANSIFVIHYKSCLFLIIFVVFLRNNIIWGLISSELRQWQEVCFFFFFALICKSTYAFAVRAIGLISVVFNNLFVYLCEIGISLVLPLKTSNLYLPFMMVMNLLDFPLGNI